MTDINRKWIVAAESATPGISLERECFGTGEEPVPEPGDGEVLIRNCYYSCDPMNHAWVKGLEARFEAIPVGGTMRGGIAGRVVKTRHPAFKEGEGVTGFLDWADYSVSNGLDHTGTPLQRVPAGFDLASGLATLGMTGQCAYFGMFDIGRPRPSDTIVVSGAAGAIGTIAGQLGKLAGGRVIGIAGGEKKCRVLTDDLGFDAAIDYKNEDVMERMGALCPSGIDVFFDNVGGPILDAAFAHIARRARIVVCGGISGYNSQVEGLQNHVMLAIHGASMGGFFYFDYVDRFGEAVDRLGTWMREGKVKEVLDIAEGFEAVPDAALGQFAGANLGKQLVRIAADPGA